MADAVQQVMDQMVPALRDFVDKGIFNDREVKGLVDKRREYEYLLRRQAVRKSDFLIYLTFEMNLLKLYTLRVSSLKKTSSSPSDHHIEQHIHLIFRRGLRKFKGDVQFWLQYIDFCKKNSSNKKLSTIFAESLQMHPTNVSLWLEAASWEYFQNSSIQNSRTLLQRCIRVNPKSPLIYVEYFKLELHYIQKLRGRREVLQLDGIKGRRMEEDGTFGGDVPILIYKQGVGEVEGVEFRLKFLEAAEETEKIEKVIMESIEKDYGELPEGWIGRAAWSLKLSPQEALKVLEKGVTVLKESSEMFELSLDFLAKLAEEDEDVGATYESFIKKAEKVSNSSYKLVKILAEFKLAQDNGLAAIKLIEESLAGDEKLKSSKDLVNVYILLAGIYAKLGKRSSGIKTLTNGLQSIEWELNEFENKALLASHTVDMILTEGSAENVELAKNVIKSVELSAVEPSLIVWLRYAMGENQSVYDVFNYVKNTIGGGAFVLNFLMECLKAEGDMKKRREIWESVVQAVGGGEGGRGVKRVLEEWEKEEEEEGDESMARKLRIRKANVQI
ncbi:hypothetical protein TL16_g08199 [Triparma laevis f. inornata]|uniref:U3 small nucleolar RNA-associated protein 6 N-terminal domain-containing protein n=1 Tax=Triparma laevis f. inornata TaxID=1714386 RepID=A0A9W7B1Y4_9STRA|nr:hypothetical protein TL16_g08199 [Triparma laevis f. inornata]